MHEEPRIAPTPQGTWSDEQIRAVAPMMPPAGSVYAERRARRGGAGGNQALSLLVRNPALAEAFLTFNRHLLYEGTVDERTREIVVLRVSWQLRSEYEWGQHVLVAPDCGISEREIDQIRVGPEHAEWSRNDAALLRAVDGLLFQGQIDDASWAELHGIHGDESMLELIFTVGAYATLAMAFNAAKLPLDDAMTGFPDER